MTDHLRDGLQAALGAGYRIERELGGGGMSRVFVARDLSLDRDVVVKVLPSESTAGVNADRFRREIQVIARLQHPHIIPILAAGAADSSLYYLMPFMGGETLRARISREGPLSVADTARILREVLDALAFAHKHGVIHRDIKPDNVLLEAGHAVVADFGIAKALRESGTMTSAGMALGTPGYLAPEQATADPTADHRADLYSVGVMAYEMLTGAPLFTGTVQQVVSAHITTAPAPLRDRRSDVPPLVADVVMRALAKDPDERPQSAGEMLGALDAAVTPMATTPVDLAPARKSYRTLLYALAAAVVLIAGALAMRSRASGAVVIKGAEVIAVMPLEAVSDSSLARLGKDLVVTLTANLDGVGSLHTTDAVTTLSRTRTLTQPVPLAVALKLGRELGAQSVLTGTLIAEGDRVRASVVLHRVIGDTAIAKATAIASASTGIMALTDSLTWQILHQIWRRGTAPSPVLTGLTTSSLDALRAFLDGEQRFQQLDAEGAQALYHRAFELDTNFVQAYMRSDYVRSWHGAPPDTMVRRHLLALAVRLPERERAWLEIRQKAVPLPAKFVLWKEFVAKYPDYPPGLMQAGDLILHAGAYYGIPVSEARPFFDRLVALTPDDADAYMHRAFVARIDGRPADADADMRAAEKITGDSGYTQLAWNVLDIAGDSAHRKTTARADSILRFQVRMFSKVRDQGVWTGSIGYRLPREAREALYRHFRSTGLLQGDMSRRAELGEGVNLIGNGYWSDGLRMLQRAEAADVSMGLKMHAARMSAIGAWMGVVSVPAADSALTRIRALPQADSVPVDRRELHWLDGLIGVTQADEPRVRRAIRELAGDTARSARTMARSLYGLSLVQRSPDAGADSLRALCDETMEKGGSAASVEEIDRLVVARALRRRGTPAAAERYLMIADYAASSPRASVTLDALSPLVAYERGVARDEAGDKAAATWHLQWFVDRYTNPPEAHKPLVADAKKRLARLTGDAPR